MKCLTARILTAMTTFCWVEAVPGSRLVSSSCSYFPADPFPVILRSRRRSHIVFPTSYEPDLPCCARLLRRTASTSRVTWAMKTDDAIWRRSEDERLSSASFPPLSPASLSQSSASLSSASFPPLSSSFLSLSSAPLPQSSASLSPAPFPAADDSERYAEGMWRNPFRQPHFRSFQAWSRVLIRVLSTEMSANGRRYASTSKGTSNCLSALFDQWGNNKSGWWGTVTKLRFGRVMRCTWKRQAAVEMLDRRFIGL